MNCENEQMDAAYTETNEIRDQSNVPATSSVPSGESTKNDSLISIFVFFGGGFPSAFHSATFVNLRSLMILDRKQSVYIFQQHVNTTRTIQVISINVGLAAGPPNVAAVTDVTCICRACPTVSQGWKTNWIDDYR